MRLNVQDLDSIWEREAANWAGAGEAAGEAATAVPRRNADLSPEQLHLISAHFDKASSLECDSLLLDIRESCDSRKTLQTMQPPPPPPAGQLACSKLK